MTLTGDASRPHRGPLGFMQLDRWSELQPPAMTALVRWMASWDGLGAVVVGMAAQSYNIELREYLLGWRVIFYWTVTAHSVAWGSGWESTRRSPEPLQTRRPPDG